MFKMLGKLKLGDKRELLANSDDGSGDSDDKKVGVVGISTLLRLKKLAKPKETVTPTQAFTILRVELDTFQIDVSQTTQKRIAELNGSENAPRRASLIFKDESTVATNGKKRDTSLLLFRCLKSVIALNQRRRVQEKLQDMMLDWLMPKAMPREPSFPQIDSATLLTFAHKRLEFYYQMRSSDKERYVGQYKKNHFPPETVGENPLSPHLPRQQSTFMDTLDDGMNEEKLVKRNVLLPLEEMNTTSSFHPWQTQKKNTTESWRAFRMGSRQKMRNLNNMKERSTLTQLKSKTLDYPEKVPVMSQTACSFPAVKNVEEFGHDGESDWDYDSTNYNTKMDGQFLDDEPSLPRRQSIAYEYYNELFPDQFFSDSDEDDGQVNPADTDDDKSYHSNIGESMNYTQEGFLLPENEHNALRNVAKIGQDTVAEKIKNMRFEKEMDLMNENTENLLMNTELGERMVPYGDGPWTTDSLLKRRNSIRTRSPMKRFATAESEVKKDSRSNRSHKSHSFDFDVNDPLHKTIQSLIHDEGHVPDSKNIVPKRIWTKEEILPEKPPWWSSDVVSIASSGSYGKWSKQRHSGLRTLYTLGEVDPDAVIHIDRTESVFAQMPRDDGRAPVSLWKLCEGDTQNFTCLKDDTPPPTEISEPDLYQPGIFQFPYISSKVQAGTSGLRNYIQGCILADRVPRMLGCLLDNTGELDLTEITAPEIEALNVALEHIPPLHSIILPNSKCNGEHIAELMTTVCVNGVRAQALKKLDLSLNKNLGERTMGSISFLIKEEMLCLTDLQLNGCRFTKTAFATISQAICHQGMIESIGMAECEIGITMGSEQSVTKILTELPYLKRFIVPLNHFSSNGFRLIGKALEVTPMLEELDVSHNSGDHLGVNVVHPLLPLLFRLRRNITLKRLNLASTSADFCCAFVLEVSLQDHPKMEIVDLSDNALGSEGIRCILRLLMRAGSQLYSIDLSGIRDSFIDENAIAYEFASPEKVYEIDLGHPQHRALVIVLLNRMEGNKASLKESFKDCTLNGKPAGIKELVIKDKKTNNWEIIPQSGTASFEFILVQQYDSTESCAAAMRNFFRKRKIPVTLGRFLTIFSIFRNFTTDMQRILYVKAIGKDLMLKAAQVKVFVKDSPHLSGFMVRHLFPCVETVEERQVLFELVRSNDQAQATRKESRAAFFFNHNNCNDRYRLDLSNPCERSVLERLIAISVYEHVIQVKKNMPDMSEYGSRDGFRNARINKKRFLLKADWAVPFDGIVSFDFVSVFKVSMEEAKKRPPMAEIAFDRLLSMFIGSPVAVVDQIKAIRMISHSFILIPEQVIRFIQNRGGIEQAKLKIEQLPKSDKNGVVDDIHILDLAENPLDENSNQSVFMFEAVAIAVEIFVCFFGRCDDHRGLICPDVLYNEELFPEYIILMIRERLGVGHTFDAMNFGSKFSNLGNTHTLDLSKMDEWQVLRLLIKVNSIEPGEKFYNCWWSMAKWLERTGQDYIIPSTWENEPPKEGRFIVTYHDGNPNSVNRGARRHAAKEFLCWPYYQK